MVYGCNRAVDRKTLGDKLRVLHGIIGAKAWILGGDFNFVRNIKEKSDMDSFDMSLRLLNLMLVLGMWKLMT